MGSPRNLVLIGVFCCVYFVVMFSGGMLGIFSPIMIMVGGIISTLINGIVIMLYLAKVPQFGSLTIHGSQLECGNVHHHIFGMLRRSVVCAPACTFHVAKNAQTLLWVGFDLQHLLIPFI